MKKVLMLNAILLIASIQTMDITVNTYAALCDDQQRLPQVFGNYHSMVPEQEIPATPLLLAPRKTYNAHLWDYNQTIEYDYTNKHVQIKKPLLMQLCVQTSKNDPYSLNAALAFQELQVKIREHHIDISEENVWLTKRDLYNRLLSNIFTDQYANSIVNGKRVFFSFISFETEEDKIKNQKIREQYNVLSNKSDRSSWTKEWFPKWFNSGVILLANYSFEKDVDHHYLIEQQFNRFIYQ